MKKFILTDETIEVNNVLLHRIKSLCTFNDVKEGDLGGFVEKESNLLGNSFSWVYDNAMVFGNAIVSGDAVVRGNAVVRGDAVVRNDSEYIVFKNWWSSGRYFTWTRSK